MQLSSPLRLAFSFFVCSIVSEASFPSYLAKIEVPIANTDVPSPTLLLMLVTSITTTSALPADPVDDLVIRDGDNSTMCCPPQGPDFTGVSIPLKI